jgi:hypothetical protein
MSDELRVTSDEFRALATRHSSLVTQMDESTLTQYILDTFPGVHSATAWGDTFFYYNPDRTQPDEIYFATLKTADDEYDNASALNRPGVFRLNVGIGKESFFALFPERPARPGPAGDFDPAYDFTALDQLLPHPVYGRQYWISVLNPGPATFERLRPLLAEAYQRAVAQHERKTR